MSITLKFIFFFLISLWLFGIFIEFAIPFSSSLSYAYPFLDRIYASVCHQQVEKLIVIKDQSSLVCSRCSGIYLGGFISSFILLFVSKIKITNGKFIIFAALPMFVDVVLYSIGIYSYSKSMALITGLLFGLVGIVYIYNGLQILVEKNA